MRNTSTLFFRV